ncbi:hypothetical protein GCK72_001839 [Caenorhabditis remanei]|uniref:Uncharacterized protein n=1 Tax=Caenorhabditis remanei TaxID=31234 RepID=A0A6A5HW50_CAERE|nr:hypothetical protein GCK72_001839 [Caenorhabditis remanei]KAF1770022.1 hypothetical protein GCK72_001839 [Caenorhabditis remanei]
MNQPLNFPIPEKSIYQMGFNSTATQPAVTNYVHEPHPLTNHLLDLLNPQNMTDIDKKRQLFSELMAPHYEKQAEIEKKIDVLSDVVNQFIKSQQGVNQLILERVLCVQEQCSSPISNTIVEDNQMDEQEPSQESTQTEEVEDKNERESDEQNETIANQQTINNPMPVYPVPISHDASLHSPIRNRSISPEKMETGEMSVRDFLKNTMTVQKADEKILEEELERERDEAAQAIRYNKFRVRNRPKKYKRSAVTFTSSLESTPVATSSAEPSSSTIENLVAESSQAMEQLLDQTQQENDSIEVEENVFQPIVVPCVQRASELDLSLMPSVFPTTSSYVLNSALDSTAHAAQNSLSALTDAKFQTDPSSMWKAVDSVTHLLVDAPSLLESDLRFPDHSHHSSFLPFVHEPLHHRSAFVPAQYNKDRRIHQQMETNFSDNLRSL